MRYPASEKHEIIRIVEQSHLPARRTLEQLGHPDGHPLGWRFESARIIRQNPAFAVGPWPWRS